MNTTHWNKTEAVRRWRMISAEAKRRYCEVEGIGISTEIGYRTNPVIITSPEDERYDPNDDLSDFGGAVHDELRRNEDLRRKGMVLHVYFRQNYEFAGVCTVWLGNDQHPPAVLGI